MSNSHDTLAILLAADDYPALRDDPAYIEAQTRLEASEELKQAYEEARAFNERHPVLVDAGRMPNDVRERIGHELERHAPLRPKGMRIELSPWTVRSQFAKAAIFLLLLTGMAMLATRISQQQASERQMARLNHLPPEDAFRSFLGQVANDPELDHRSSDTTQLVGWLENRASTSLKVPEQFQAREGIGCAYMDGPNGKVSLICMDVDDRTIHLFVADAANIGLTRPHPPERLTIRDRDALQWNDEERVYMLMTHDAGDKLPDEMLL